MRSFQDTFETRKRPFSILFHQSFFNLHDCTFKDTHREKAPVNKTPTLSEIKGALSGLRQYLATESPIKIMRNVFYSISRALFVLKIFRFLS